ncbi:MAG: cyanophycin synthetase [Bacillota bacterium]|nr:cyanophycin synthetase [Bacillota bacterium]
MATEQIEICDFTIYNTRNIYSHRPVMKMVVDIGKYHDIPTNKIPGFNERLLEIMPGLKTNFCGLGYEGGFLDRLNEGTYIAHVLEHMVLEMQYMVGYDVHYGKTRVIEEPSLYYLVYEFQNEVCGIECGKACVYILNCLLTNEKIDIEDFLYYLRKVSQDAELGPSTSAIVDEAKNRGIPVTRIGNESLVRLGYGRHSRIVESTLTDATSCISADISCNKQLTKFILSENQIPVPIGKVVYSEISALDAASKIGMPVVVKPFDGNQGKGVHLNLKNKDEIKAAFREASKFSKGIIVEKYVKGKDFRILVVGDKVCAAAERIPAGVIGDGKHTVAELVELVNDDPSRGEQHEKPLTKIKLDNVSVNVLKKNGLTVDSVPENAQFVALRENGNLSTGGIAIDCTDIIHPDNADIAVRAANAIGIDIAGIDIVTDDISKSIFETGGVVVEVNTAPGIRMHLYPSKGKPRNVAKEIINLLFPDENTTRFPIVSVTGTNGKTTVSRLIQHVLSIAGLSVGLTSTSGTYINRKCICKGDNSGPRSARSLLANKNIDAAVLETARGGLVREGLGYDLADVGVITNIAEDHLGLDGIDTIEDLAFVKSLVIEAIKEDGAAVLNAADPMTPKILERVKTKVILFSKNKQDAKQYIGKNYTFVYLDKNNITIEDGKKIIAVTNIQNVPITLGGLIDCNVENTLTAVSALYALKIPVEIIKKGLNTFVENSGRFNMFDLDNVRVMLDYGHNPAGYEQVLKTCKKLDHNNLIGIIGMPGDRMNSAMQQVGKMCAECFDKIYIKEDLDLRGRQNGEVAKIFYDSIIEIGYSKDNVIIIEGEVDALKQALDDANKNDLIVCYYEKLEPLQKLLLDRGATKVKSFMMPVLI